MTREECKNYIGELKMYAKSQGWDEEYQIACDVAMNELEQEPILDKIRAEIIKYEGDCRLSVDEYPSCKQCTDSVFETIYGILDKYKAESEGEDGNDD